MESTENAIKEIIAFLRRVAPDPEVQTDIGIREWVSACVEQAKVDQMVADWEVNKRAAQESIREAATTMLKALEIIDKGIEHNICQKQTDPKRFEREFQNFTSLKNTGRFMDEVKSLTCLEVQKKPVKIYQIGKGDNKKIFQIVPNNSSGKGRKPLSEFVISIHHSAKKILNHWGIKSTTGSSSTAKKDESANVAKLGGLLCAAAGQPLPSGESTKAARLVCLREEAFEYVRITEISGAPEPSPNPVD